MPALQTLYCTICIHKSYKAHCTVSAARHSPYRILRFTVNSKNLLLQLNLYTHMVIYRPGISDKHPEICHSPVSSSEVSGLHGGNRPHDNLPANSQGSGNTEDSDSTSITEAYASKGSSTDDWDAGTVATKTAVTCSLRSEDSGTLMSPILARTAHQGSKVRSPMVHLYLSLLKPNSDSRSCTSNRVRCQLRLGCQGVRTGGRWTSSEVR